MFRSSFLKLLTPFMFVVAANAAIITFSGVDPGANDTDPRPNSNAVASSFNTAVASLGGSDNLITFESAPVGSFTNLTVAPGVTINGTDFVGDPQTIRNTPSGNPDALFGYNTTPGGANFLYVNGGTVTFTFSPGVDAFGAYFTGVQLAGETITFSDGSTETETIPNPGASGGAEFFGFTDAGASIASITIVTPNPSNSSGDLIGVDDVRYGTGSVVVTGTPEPATMFLLGSGFACLSLLRRRRRS